MKAKEQEDKVEKWGLAKRNTSIIAAVLPKEEIETDDGSTCLVNLHYRPSMSILFVNEPEVKTAAVFSV
jgi:hypothetical protein